MTLIATVQLNGGSALIGDLLVTRPRLGSDPDSFILPFGRTKEDARLAASPVAYMQKVLILHPRVALAWTGPVTKRLDAVIAGMRSAAQSGQGDQAALVAAMSKLERAGKLKELALICVAVDQQNTVHTLLYGSVGIPNIPGLRAAVAGSGRNQFLEVLRRLWGDGRPFIDMHGPHLGLAGVLVAGLADLEAVHKVTTAAAYGGGYEIVYWAGEEFTKCDELIVVKAALDLGTDGYALHPPLSYVATRYDEHDLLITSLIPDPLRAETYMPYGAYARSPEGRSGTKREAHQPFFNGEVYAVSLALYWEDQFVCDLSHLTGGQPKPLHIQVDESRARMSVVWNSEFEKHMLEQGKAAVLTRHPEARFGD